MSEAPETQADDPSERQPTPRALAQGTIREGDTVTHVGEKVADALLGPSAMITRTERSATSHQL